MEDATSCRRWWRSILNRSVITLAHDYITQRGGAERVVLALHRAMPESPIVTALFNINGTFPDFAGADVRSSFLNRLPIFRKNPQAALVALPFAWMLRREVRSEGVLISSSGWAHGIRVARGTKKVVYCHNPPRWLYQTEDYLLGRKLPIRWVLATVAPLLRLWDQHAARGVDTYLANSTSVQKRIEEAYGRHADVVFPPVMIDAEGPQEIPAPDLPTNYFLAVGRRRGYKGIEKIAQAFAGMPEQNLVIVGEMPAALPGNVRVVRDVSDAGLRWLYAHAQALVSIAREDFGLSPLEANAFGTPALLVRSGGFVDSLDEGVSGLFFASIDAPTMIASIRNFPKQWDRGAIKAHAGKFNETAFVEKLLSYFPSSPGASLDRDRAS
ncbi:glycosyltransferase [Curtobacterium sp. MCSS17_007]|uniref:glycosyltransferase n=1 Tax=Curtobacterium sp. MCSS17_007 TaxID=2175646 RepID=UPI0024DFFDD1|nr:glycosyltransferase [Curtobacterium sp. MCSS17_007]WIE76141.1 glycosyltransferase [Curtobacterium sp. MCSS17_007]